MKAINVNYNTDKEIIKAGKDKIIEDWSDVCEKFNNDVHRIREVSDYEEYTSLYECFDEDNVSFFYLVREDEELYKIRRKNRLRGLGLAK
ncbi:MAG: hypothetical protein HN737_08700 [Desulfobacterales bacterium]|nr:hypothetical protein [Desulfobacteraceae bacterium]MBT4365269.1 hypothetical protein [Desulfobacteraceae bacterium]MBT7084699.1 hypothetical protein [Desulfobacterales bacterium]MBT7697475.1 hypothetical protein [Desulfobacterales bacterium]